MATIVTRTGKGSALTTAEMDANLNNLNNDKIEAVSDDTGPSLGGNLDVGTNNIYTSDAGGIVVVDDNLRVTGGNISVDVANTNLNLTPGSGTGAINLQGSNGVQVSSGSLFTATANGNMTLSANGSGYILLNQAGSVIVTDTAASGYGVITGATSTGLGLMANAGAQGATDSKIQITSGGGITVQAGSGSTATITGNAVDITGAVTMNNTATITGDATLTSLKTYTEKLQTVSGSGTLTIDPTAGPIKYVVPTGNITINGFSSPVAGQTVTFLIDNSTYATSYTLTLGAAILVPGGTAPSLTASGNDLLTITCIDATTPVYIANVVNDFQ